MYARHAGEARPAQAGRLRLCYRFGDRAIPRPAQRPQRAPGFDPAACFRPGAAPVPALRTRLGALYRADCREILPRLRGGSVDTVFADPPFNLGKQYGAGVRDLRPHDSYLAWCRAWLGECARALRPGGSLLVYNLPRWNVLLGACLDDLGMTFRHWIAVEAKSGLPIPRRLYPAHYSLLYTTKGDGHTFRRIRVPVPSCRHCGGDLKDYGGHRGALNPRGLNLTDVWSDIPPVRHRKFKSGRRRANQVSTKLLDRVVEMTTRPGDLVLDPFGGSGTTFDVCERKGRRWIGVEIGPVDAIAERLSGSGPSPHDNDDWVEG